MSYRRELIQIRPTNLGNGKFGSREGLPQLIFEIPQVPKIMNGKSLKISGNFSTFASSGVRPNNSTQFFQQTANNTNDVVYMDGRTGVSSCYDVVSIQSLSNGQTYENIKNYNRLCSSLMPLSDSIKSYLNGGIDGIYGGLSKEVSTARKCDRDFSFATPLLAGFLQGNPIDLNLVGGLRIVITLAPDNFVLRNNRWRFNTNQGGVNSGGAFYELSDMMLTFEAEVPDAEGQEAMMSNMNGSWEYNAYSSYYNVIQSNDHNAVININTGKTISTIMNIIPSTFLNNYNYNSAWATQLLQEDAGGTMRNRVAMTEFTLTKGGLRIPLDFEVDSAEAQTDGTAASAKTFEELNAVREVWRLSNFEKSLKTELSLSLGDNINAGTALDQAKFSLVSGNGYSINSEDKIKCDNFGVAYDHITGNGLNFKNTPLGIRIQSTAPSGSALKPHSLFIFVKHKNTIVFNNGMVNVMN